MVLIIYSNFFCFHVVKSDRFRVVNRPIVGRGVGGGGGFDKLLIFFMFRNIKFPEKCNEENCEVSIYIIFIELGHVRFT